MRSNNEWNNWEIKKLKDNNSIKIGEYQIKIWKITEVITGK